MNKDVLTMEAADVAHEAAIKPGSVVAGTDKDNGGVWWALREFLKPSFSNLMLLGCVSGVFFIYCCSCIFHALALPFRRQVS